MGNVSSAVPYRTLKRRVSEETWRGEPEVEERLLLELQELQEVELWRLNWSLSQELLQGVPPVPLSWLRTADACSTAKTLLRCYHDDGALSVLEAALRAIGRDDWLSMRHMVYPLRPRPRVPQTLDPDFVMTRRRRLISRMQRLDAILDVLQDHNILNAANRAAVHIYAVRKDKNRALVDLVLRKGGEAQEVFYQALSQSEPFLLLDLEDGPIMDKHPSEPCVLTEMLECLVSDELRTFQWLVSDHMTGESLTPVGREKLQHADRLTTARLLREHFGPIQVENVAMNILLKMVPCLSVCLRGQGVTSQMSSDIRVETNMDTSVIKNKPEVSEDGNMFRLRCRQPGVFLCSETGLLLEGVGDVVYQTVPWDLDFLSAKGLRPAGPLFRFKLLTGSFHRVHLPHCLLDCAQHSLSVGHVTGDSVDFITPGQVTDSHVIIDISGFSCFGLVFRISPPDSSRDAIGGLVLLFHRFSDSSLFVHLLPRNVCLTQVIKTCKQRIRAEYVETIPDCELIPNQTYKLSGQPSVFIQPEVQLEDLEADMSLKLQLSHLTPLRLIGWLIGSIESLVWHQVLTLRAAASSPCTEVPVSESVNVILLLHGILKNLQLEDFKTFQRLLNLRSDPIPICQLEAADRMRTVDLMVQQYHAEGAKQVTEEILRKMNFNHLVDQQLIN
ncbi:uncharacterized protein LOC119028864 isoform X2 [Acanthopagrus latus]|uniref:uncharacterized protein LOC119028864 isoform X2 n=1 Tax=Acanthopagrus latus TaxID=8177 RepID=UPI00187CCA58|nr:uncharacterized protein LOC119028864 isoform X2 [Acanthopagrus latus]